MKETKAKSYAIHDLKTGQVVALIGADGTVQMKVTHKLWRR